MPISPEASLCGPIKQLRDDQIFTDILRPTVSQSGRLPTSVLGGLMEIGNMEDHMSCNTIEAPAADYINLNNDSTLY